MIDLLTKGENLKPFKIKQKILKDNNKPEKKLIDDPFLVGG